MKKHQFLIIIALLIAPSVTKQWRPDQQAKFQTWKVSFNKSYPSSDDEQRAMDLMLQNQEEIEAHNKKFRAGKETFERGLWKRSDMSFNEKQKLLTGTKQMPVEPEREVRQARRRKMKTAPDSVNWVSAGLVHEVDDQQVCGSCYAFATAGVVEGVLLKKGISTRVSVQQIVDCNKSNEGCGGGEPLLSLRYAKDKGLTSSSNYPYVSKEGKCKSCNSVGSVSSVGRTYLNGNENLMKEFVANYGPVAVAINAADTLMNYMSGVYNNPKCSKEQDHAVLIVGYGTDQKFGDFWLVKNSWGTSWGERGYVRMARNKKNQCGIATTVWYAT